MVNESSVFEAVKMHCMFSCELFLEGSVILKTEKDLRHRKKNEKKFWAPTRTKDFYLPFLCYFNICLRTFNIIMVLISVCNIIFAL